MMVIISFALALVLVAIDQLVKHWVVASVALNTAHPLLPHVLALTNLQNNGAAWSILEGQQWFFSLVTVVALAVILYLFYRWRHNPRLLLSLSFILAGAVGNFIDRIQHGYVVDMFETLFMNFPVFNVADCCLTIGVIWLVIIIIREEEE